MKFMTFEYWWETTGIANMGMQPGDVYRAARDTALAAWEAATNAEREACAWLCESRQTPGTGSVAILQGAADAIRARSKT